MAMKTKGKDKNVKKDDKKIRKRKEEIQMNEKTEKRRYKS